MESHTRRAVAAVVARLHGCSSATAVYDHAEHRHVHVTGTVGRSLSLYDHDASCHISGSGDGIRFSLYHHGNSGHLDLDIRGEEFQGYDYSSGCHFSGRISSRTVTMYDHGTSRHYHYSV